MLSTYVQIQFYIRSELVEVLVTADIVISDGQWHTARVEKSGRRLRVVVDGVEGMDSGAPEEELRTNSLLYIGGVPGKLYSCMIIMCRPLSWSLSLEAALFTKKQTLFA